MNLWTVGCADPRLTAPARSPMDKPGKTLCIARQSGLERRDNQDENPAPQYWHDRLGVSVVQGLIEGLIVAGRRSGVGRDCRVDRRAAAASLASKRSATAVAFDVHLEDGGVMNEAVDRR